jgi:hypothetical protein
MGIGGRLPAILFYFLKREIISWYLVNNASNYFGYLLYRSPGTAPLPPNNTYSA